MQSPSSHSRSLGSSEHEPLLRLNVRATMVSIDALPGVTVHGIIESISAGHFAVWHACDARRRTKSATETAAAACPNSLPDRTALGHTGSAMKHRQQARRI